METSLYQAAKLILVDTVGLSKDALHVYVGLGVLFVSMVLFRKPLNSFLPVCMVLLAALAGEALDMRDDVASLGYWRWRASLADVVNTLFWPVVVSLLAWGRVIWFREA